ncbi:GNAT family N-acetyltransferase [Dendrosporobacter sp. 1207_IL3150]|uniref:GNAT family N-acetyltransferase n=1 Tax=Dendrosporobacter sp. 1207_IL3150 TaxID=3084054 RepID=UPI002FD98BBB
MYNLQTKTVQNSEEQSTSNITIHVATEELEKKAIYNLRFKVFYEELSKRLPTNVVNDSQLADDLDKTSILLYAKSGSSVIGTLRMTIGEIDSFPKWLSDIFSLDKFRLLQKPNQKIGLLTKLAIDPSYRGSTLMYQFLKEILVISYAQGIRYAFGGCNPNLVSFYERMGFIRFSNKNFTDPGYGLLLPIVLITDNINHFKASRATALRFVKSKDTNLAGLDLFYKLFPQSLDVVNSRLVKGLDLLDYLNLKFSDIDLGQLLFSPSLNLKECIAFLELGSIFTCYAGDQIISSGDKNSDLYLLLSGKLACESSFLRPGQFFGFNLAVVSIQKYNVTSIGKSQIMIIPGQHFEKYKQAYPNAALNIIEKLGLSLG